MQNTQIANYILLDLRQKHKLPLDYNVNRQIISEVVDGWNENIYFVPKQAVNLWHKNNKKYYMM